MLFHRLVQTYPEPILSLVIPLGELHLKLSELIQESLHYDSAHKTITLLITF